MYSKLRTSIIYLLIIFLVLCLGIYASLHSPYVLKNFVLTFLARQIETSISVKDISFSPFSSLKVKDLRLGPDSEPTITASEVSLNYSLWEILTSKQINLKKIHLSKAHVTFFKDKHNIINLLTKPSKDIRSNSIKLDGNIDLSLNNDLDQIRATGEVLIKELYTPDFLETTSKLESTRVKFNVSYDPLALKIENLELNILDNSGPFADLSGSGDIKLPLGKERSALSLSAKLIDVDRLINLFDTLVETDAEDLSNSKYCEGINLDSLWLDTKLKVKELKYAPLQITNLDADIFTQKGKIAVKKLDWKQSEIPAHLKADIDFSNSDCKFTYLLKFEPSPFGHFLSAFGQDESGIKKGVIKKAILSGKGAGFSKEQFDKNFSGELDLEVSDAVLPSKFQDVPPFNIIFLPFKILMDLGGTLTSAVLPEELTNLGSEARGTLDETGQLNLNHASFKLKASQGKVSIVEGEINTDLLPTVGFDGDINYDASLDLTTTLHLLALQLRIPVAGSLALPLPDLVELGPQLIKGLGLSLIDPLSSVVKGEDEREDVKNTEGLPEEQ